MLLVGTPLVLIAFSIVTLVKAIVSANADEISKARGKLIKKIIISILIFVTAALVQFVINRVASNANDKSSISKCLKCFLFYKADYCPESSTGNEIYRGTQKRSDSNSSIGTEASSNSNNKSNIGNSKDRASVENSILVGDSRVDSVCSVPLSVWDTDYSGVCTNRNMLVVAHGGKGHDWFQKTAVPLVNNLLSKNSSKKYNIVFFMGLGNLGLKSDKEANNTASIYMNAMLDAIKNGSWGKNYVIVVSLTDIGKDKVYAGYAWFDR